MKIISSESKDNLRISGKGLIDSLGFKAKVRPHEYKKSRHSIGNFSKKDLSKIIWDWEKSPYGSYEKKRPKKDLTDSYFYLERKLAKCMMRGDELNSHSYHVRT